MTFANWSRALTVACRGLLLAVPGWARSNETGFLDRVVVLDGEEHNYQVFVPRQWNPRAKWPVILFLHGYDEGGSDGILPTDDGIGTAIRTHPDWVPCVVVIPQCRKHDWWTNAPMEVLALAALERTMREFHGDPRRVYLTGLSMGGYGAWALGALYPHKFAALVPICGGVRVPRGGDFLKAHDTDDSDDPFGAIAKKIGKTPVWVFHGHADSTVPVTESRQMVEALKAAGGNVRYTEYPGVGHNSWEKAYDDPGLFAWLFSQTLP